MQLIQGELEAKTYYPERNRRKGIPKANGKSRMLGIPCIKDRVVQGALKRILDPLFEAEKGHTDIALNAQRMRQLNE